MLPSRRTGVHLGEPIHIWTNPNKVGSLYNRIRPEELFHKARRSFGAMLGNYQCSGLITFD